MLAFLVLVVPSAQFVYSSLVIEYPASGSLREVPPPLRLYEAEAPGMLGANNTSINISYMLTGNSYDAVPYSSFDDGFDGWRYYENDPQGVLEGYWWEDGYISLSGRDVPGSWLGGYYGWHLIFNNLSFLPGEITGIEWSYRYSLTYSWYPSTSFEFSLEIYDWNTSSVVAVLDDFNPSETGWTSRSGSTEWRPEPGHVYAIVLLLRVPYGWLLSYSYDFFIDDVHLTVYTSSYSVENLEVANVTCLEGAYNAWLEVETVSGSGNASIILINGAYSTTKITIVNGVPVSTSTTSIPFNSSDILLRTGSIVIDASLDSGESLEASLILAYGSGGVEVRYPVRLYLYTP